MMLKKKVLPFWCIFSSSRTPVYTSSVGKVHIVMHFPLFYSELPLNLFDAEFAADVEWTYEAGNQS